MTSMKTSPVSPALSIPEFVQGWDDKFVLDADRGLDDVVTEHDVVWGDPIVGKHPNADDPSKPIELPTPKDMTAAEVLKHCTTHIPFHPGCQYCVAGKKPNVQHRQSSQRRKNPMLVADDAFLTNEISQEVIPFLVIYVLPWNL